VVAALDPVHDPAADVAESVDHHRRADLRAVLPVQSLETIFRVAEADLRELELTLAEEADGECTRLMDHLVALMGTADRGRDEARLERGLGQPGPGVDELGGLSTDADQVETVRNQTQ